MTASPQTTPRTAYKVRAMSVEACSCAHACNCQFVGTPTEGFCEFIIGYDIKEGRFGEVDLAGVRFVVAAKYPGAIHEGNAHVALFVNEGTRPVQVEALATILTGQAGGMPWEALAGTIGKLEGPILKPVELTIDGQRARVRVPGELELVTTPIKDAVSGQEKEIHIVYPKGGFFWNDGNVVTTETMRVDRETLRMSWPAKYAAVAEVRWTNAA